MSENGKFCFVRYTVFVGTYSNCALFYPEQEHVIHFTI